MKKQIIVALFSWPAVTRRLNCGSPPSPPIWTPTRRRARLSAVGHFRLDGAPRSRCFGSAKSNPPAGFSARLNCGWPLGRETKLRLTVAGKSREITVQGKDNGLVVADFGSFEVATAGYQQFPSSP